MHDDADQTRIPKGCTAICESTLGDNADSRIQPGAQDMRIRVYLRRARFLSISRYLFFCLHPTPPPLLYGVYVCDSLLSPSPPLYRMHNPVSLRIDIVLFISGDGGSKGRDIQERMRRGRTMSSCSRSASATESPSWGRTRPRKKASSSGSRPQKTRLRPVDREFENSRGKTL